MAACRGRDTRSVQEVERWVFSQADDVVAGKGIYGVRSCAGQAAGRVETVVSALQCVTAGVVQEEVGPRLLYLFLVLDCLKAALGK